MATLVNTQTQQLVRLRSQHIFGRHSGSCNTVLNQPAVSRLHATISYNGVYWLLQDNSRNGTYINEQHFHLGNKQRLQTGDLICFGQRNGQIWRLLDETAPKSLLVPFDGNQADEQSDKVIELEQLLVLPDEMQPQVMLYTDQDGHWLCEDNKGTRMLTTGQTVEVEQLQWYFVDAEIIAVTKILDDSNKPDLSEIKLTFIVSQNEEHVELEIDYQGCHYSLGDRTHHYLLLNLARNYLQDQQNDLHIRDVGWTDKSLMAQELGMSENHINIQLYRFRKHLSELAPEFALLQQIIERRKGELRFAGCQMLIHGGIA